MSRPVNKASKQNSHASRDVLTGQQSSRGSEVSKAGSSSQQAARNLQAAQGGSSPHQSSIRSRVSQSGSNSERGAQLSQVSQAGLSSQQALRNPSASQCGLSLQQAAQDSQTFQTGSIPQQRARNLECSRKQSGSSSQPQTFQRRSSSQKTAKGSSGSPKRAPAHKKVYRIHGLPILKESPTHSTLQGIYRLPKVNLAHGKVHGIHRLLMQLKPATAGCPRTQRSCNAAHQQQKSALNLRAQMDRLLREERATKGLPESESDSANQSQAAAPAALTAECAVGFRFTTILVLQRKSAQLHPEGMDGLSYLRQLINKYNKQIPEGHTHRKFELRIGRGPRDSNYDVWCFSGSCGQSSSRGYGTSKSTFSMYDTENLI